MFWNRSGERFYPHLLSSVMICSAKDVSNRPHTGISKTENKSKGKGAEPPLKVLVLTTFVGYTPRWGDAIGAAVGDQLAHVLTGVRDSDQRR